MYSDSKQVQNSLISPFRVAMSMGRTRRQPQENWKHMSEHHIILMSPTRVSYKMRYVCQNHEQKVPYEKDIILKSK